jgi:hypothetical protein
VLRREKWRRVWCFGTVTVVLKVEICLRATRLFWRG